MGGATDDAVRIDEIVQRCLVSLSQHRNDLAIALRGERLVVALDLLVNPPEQAAVAFDPTGEACQVPTTVAPTIRIRGTALQLCAVLFRHTPLGDAMLSGLVVAESPAPDFGAFERVRAIADGSSHH